MVYTHKPSPTYVFDRTGNTNGEISRYHARPDEGQDVCSLSHSCVDYSCVVRNQTAMTCYARYGGRKLIQDSIGIAIDLLLPREESQAIRFASKALIPESIHGCNAADDDQNHGYDHRHRSPGLRRLFAGGVIPAMHFQRKAKAAETLAM